MEQPAARVDVVTETRFGVELADPYRWMEEDSAEFADWTAKQGEYAEEYLRELPGRSELLARVTELTASTATFTRFSLAGDLVFFLRQDVDADVPVLVVRNSSGDRVLLDPAELAGDEHSHLDWYVPSPDGSRVAAGISQGGSENSTLRIIDVAMGALSTEAIPGTFHGVVSWLPDSTGFVYHRYRDPAPGTPPAERRLNSGTYLHLLGTAPEDDVLVLARDVNPHVSMTPRDRPFIVLPAGSDWAIAIISHSSLTGTVTERLSACTLYAAPRVAIADPATCPWRLVADRTDGVTAHATHGDTLYLVSHRDAPRSHVLAVSLPAAAEPKVVVPGSERAVVAVHVVGEDLLVRDVDGGVSRLRRVPLAGGVPVDVPLPVEGTITEQSGSSALLVLSSWTQSPRACRYHDGVVEDTGWISPSPIDFGDVVLTELRVPVRDGSLVPMTVLHRKDIALDGDNPTLLHGYGSYGYVWDREFTPELLAWCERGGVYAHAGLRGGGEYGREWHEAGRGQNKENTITDFIDCAEYLVSAGYTRPGRLAGEGGSAGGIPTGGALVRRPDLWAAMVMHVPVTNLTRQEFDENGPINVPEFGTVTTEDGLRDLLIIDAYLRVEDKTRYPAVLLTAGLNDPRVGAWQPAKMAARLQAASASGRPVLFRVDSHAGHGFGTTREQRNAETADMFAFLLAELI